MVSHRSVGFFMLAVMLVGLSGIAAADDALGISASAAIAVPSFTVPSAFALIGNGTLEANGSVSSNGTVSDQLHSERQVFHEEIRQIQDDARDRARQIRQNVSDAIRQIRSNGTDGVQNSRDSIRDVRQMAQGQLAQARHQRQQEVEHARDVEANLTAKVKTLAAKGLLNDSEKAELAAQAQLQLLAAYNHRMQLAKRMEIEGANASVVSKFLAFAQSNWNQYANATNATAKNELIAVFNQRWAQFRQSVLNDVLLVKLQAAVNASRGALVRLDAVLAKLSTAGFNTTGLVNQSARISALLDSASSAPDLPTAVFRLRQAHGGLVHLRGAIQHLLNHERVESYRETPMPSATIDASLAILGTSVSHTAAGATATPSTPPTNGVGSASASGFSTTNASGGSVSN